MQQRSFSFNGAIITVRSEIGADALDSRLIGRPLLARVGFDHRDVNRISYFVACVVQSTVEGDLGFPWVQPGAKEEDVFACYQAWLAAPIALVMEWTSAIDAVNVPPGDPDLFPPDALPEEKKETSAS